MDAEPGEVRNEAMREEVLHDAKNAVTATLVGEITNMAGKDFIPDVSAASDMVQDGKLGRKGVLVPLKTTMETRARERVVEVYVTAVSPKQASNTLNLTRSLIPTEGGLDLQHLRRFAKYTDVPSAVRSAYQEELAKHAFTFDEPEASTNLFLVVASVNSVSRTVVLDALSVVDGDGKAIVFTTNVPLLASTSAEQARRWSEVYWPTVYKKSNPFGPHPSIVSRAEEEIVGEFVGWMELAGRVAGEAGERGMGERVGVVIVERRKGVGRVVAVAGDARWDGDIWKRDKIRGREGNVAAHAAMRGIAMVAVGLRAEGQARESKGEDDHLQRCSEHQPEPSSATANHNLPDPSPDEHKILPPASPKAKSSIFRDTPLTPLEAQHLYPSGDGNGYLCHNLEIYCTHEPCVMCSMAIVHSRFGKVVFGKRMHETGGLCADVSAEGQGLGHGLFWRKELNWNMLAWEWRSGGGGVVEGEFLNA